MSDPNWGDELERDLTRFITSTALLVENAVDALQVLWLVECGVLPVMKKPLTKEQSQCLGHGNVMVWLDRKPESLDITIDDGRIWKFPIRRRGLWIYEERKEFSELCRYHLTARRNVLGNDDNSWWHLVAYHDMQTFARPTPRLEDTPRHKACAGQMPYGYFVPEFGKATTNVPPPMQPADYSKILESLPPPEVALVEEPASPVITVTTTTEVSNTQFIPQHRKAQWDTKSTAPYSVHVAPDPLREKLVAPEIPQERKSSEVSHCEIELSAFEAALFSNPYSSSQVRNIASSIAEDAKYQGCLDLYGGWARLVDDMEPSDVARMTTRRLLDVIRAIDQCATIQGMEGRYECITTNTNDPPSLIGIPKAEKRNVHWHGAFFFVVARPEEHRDPSYPTDGSDSDLGDTAVLGAFAPSQTQKLGRGGKRIFECAFQMMTHGGTRRHVVGIDLEGLMARFWYFDRAGSVCTSPINIRVQPERFINAVLLLQHANGDQLGSETTLTPKENQFSTFDSIEGCQLAMGTSMFEVIRPVHITRSLYGRCASFFEAQAKHLPGTHPNATVLPERVIVKFSWQLVTQRDEEEHFRLAEQHGVEGVGKLYLAKCLARLSNSYRGQFCPRGSYQDRELRVQILGPVCVPLYTITDLTTFKSAFRALVRAHHDLYEKAGILHCDINVNNLMVNVERPDLGILLDLDLAVKTREHGAEIDAAATRIGTRPFLATDLLLDSDLRHHLYRFDLESFVFALAWIMAYYRDGKDIDASPYRSWHSGDLNSIGHLKREFLTHGDDTTRWQFGGLKSTWMRRLAEEFAAGFAHGDGMDNFATLNGHVTYESFCAILES